MGQLEEMVKGRTERQQTEEGSHFSAGKEGLALADQLEEMGGISEGKMIVYSVVKRWVD